MTFTEEMLAEDEKCWHARNVVAELGYCGNYMRNRKNMTNLDIRFYAYIMRKAYYMLKEQEWHMLTEDDDGIIHGLPGDDGQYLMSDGKEIWIDEYADGVADGIFLDSGRDIREIKAWKYMPDLPKTDRR